MHILLSSFRPTVVACSRCVTPVPAITTWLQIPLYGGSLLAQMLPPAVVPGLRGAADLRRSLLILGTV